MYVLCAMLNLSVMSSSFWPHVTTAHQAPLSTGILQARILEWVAMPSSRESSQPRDRTKHSYIAGRFFTVWATREALVNHRMCLIVHTIEGRLILCLRTLQPSSVFSEKPSFFLWWVCVKMSNKYILFGMVIFIAFSLCTLRILNFLLHSF